MLLDPRVSKRQRYGIYELGLNKWINQHSRGAEFVLDVGASDGYHTFGFAHLLQQQGGGRIICFEPDERKWSALREVAAWPEYNRCEIELVPKLVGAADRDDLITLDSVDKEFALDEANKGLVKVDVEGAELEVLNGALGLLDRSEIDWIVEIHGKHLIPLVCKFFVSRMRPFLLLDELKIPFLAMERRLIRTFWLVTI